ncbi:MAG: NDP-sugar pyrophosphorylase family protein [Flavobacteriales bacterium]|jgi:glucose-1-phosphate adenylyltransferase
MTKTLIILAGGASSRMKKSTTTELSEEAMSQANNRSKSLILMNDRPMMDYILYNAKLAGITEVILVIGPQGDLFKTYYGSKTSGNDFHGLTISYAIQHIPLDRVKPLGTADAVFQALEQYPELQKTTFLVCNSDNLYSPKVMFALRESTHPNALISYDRGQLKYPMERIARFAVLKTTSERYVEGIVEKPEVGDMAIYKDSEGHFRVSMNIFKFDGSSFFKHLKNCEIHPVRLEKELPTVIRTLIAEDSKAIRAIPFGEHVPDLTGKNDITAMNEYLSKHYASLDWTQKPEFL